MYYRKYHFIGQTNTKNIQFTWGKSALNLGSVRYNKPIVSKQNIHLKSGIYENGMLQFYREDSFIYHQAIGSIQHINLKPSTYHPSYVASGKMALVDGKIGSDKDLKSGLWQGFRGGNLQVDLMLDKPKTIQSFAMGFYQNTPSWVILPKTIEIYTSNDGIQYQLLTTISHKIDISREDAMKHTFRANWPKRKMRYVRVIAKYAGHLPAKHPGAGLPSMMFADEIMLD